MKERVLPISNHMNVLVDLLIAITRWRAKAKLSTEREGGCSNIDFTWTFLDLIDLIGYRYAFATGG